jgi:acyl-CoA thioesterase-2
MSDPVSTLMGLLDVERLERNLFRGLGAGGETTRRIFGGQVVAQALAAACRTVRERECHSLHAYFLRPGDPSIPVIYEVDRARDGGSFTTRRVVAIQHGRQIFNMAASFHLREEGMHHQHEMPVVPGPEELPNWREARERMAQDLPEGRRADFLRPSAIDACPVQPYDYVSPEAADASHAWWFRLARPVEGSGTLHQCLLAYASDKYLLGASLRPHGESYVTGNVMTASLDHALWFHNPVSFNDWHLYVMDSPFAGHARGFTRGSIFSRDGTLVASTAQEGLVRPVRKS